MVCTLTWCVSAFQSAFGQRCVTNPYTGVEVCSEDEEELKALEDIFDVPDMIDICSTWSKSIIELTYNVDDELEGMVGDALVKLGLEYNNKTEDADIIIKVGEYSSEPGHTDYTYNNIGQIMHSDIVIAEKTEERVIHELMHGLGIGHANYPTSIMSEVIVPGAKLSACEFDAIAAVVDVAGTSDSVCRRLSRLITIGLWMGGYAVITQQMTRYDIGMHIYTLVRSPTRTCRAGYTYVLVSLLFVNYQNLLLL